MRVILEALCKKSLSAAILAVAHRRTRTDPNDGPVVFGDGPVAGVTPARRTIESRNIFPMLADQHLAASVPNALRQRGKSTSFFKIRFGPNDAQRPPQPIFIHILFTIVAFCGRS
jgi:hypothetical protein